VVLSANLLANLMDRYPITIYIGAGILGRVGGDMILTDSFVTRQWHLSRTFEYIVEGVLAVVLMVGGKILCDRRKCRR
jgi:predicted tellurium resistance membrane protein TerC